MTTIYNNGIGDALGDRLATCKPLQMSGNVWYVANGGFDATGTAGQNRERPLATLGQANTNAADYDVIVLMDGYTEVRTGALSFTKKLTIVGAGSAGGKPTVKLGNNSTSSMFVINNTSLLDLRNIWFTPNEQDNSGVRLNVVTGSTGFRMRGCYVECGSHDQGAALQLGVASHVSLIDTTFISVATDSAAQPATAVALVNTVTDMIMDGVTFSSGTMGFSNYRAFDGSAAAITGLKAGNISLLLGADVLLNSGSVGYVNVGTCTGGSRVDW